MKRNRKILSVLLALMICLSSMTVCATDMSQSAGNTTPLGRQWITGEDLGTATVESPKTRSTTGSNVVITPGASLYYGSWETCKFTMSTETGSYLGFCAEPDCNTPSGVYRVSKLNHEVIEALVLLYTIPELYNSITIPNAYYTTGYEYVFTHVAIGYVYCGSLTGTSSSTQSGIKTIVSLVTTLVNGTDTHSSGQAALLRKYLNTYELHIAYNNEQDIVWAEKTPDVETSLILIKKQGNTDVGLCRAEFEHTKPDGTTEVLTTDENGQIFISKLSYGNHTLQETVSPKGYLLNETAIQFQVDKYGTIKVNSESELLSKGVLSEITSQNTTKKNISFTVYDEPVPYSLKIHKVNQNQIQLEGAEYGLYLDITCDNEVASRTTDEKGALSFEGLQPEVTYYLKEKTAPLGYRLQTEESGEAIVTEIRVSSIPAQDNLQLYVNGELYDFLANTQFSVTGTKAQPEITLTQINEVGYLLPETGSTQTVVLTVIAIAVLWRSLKKKNQRDKNYRINK